MRFRQVVAIHGVVNLTAVTLHRLFHDTGPHTSALPGEMERAARRWWAASPPEGRGRVAVSASRLLTPETRSFWYSKIPRSERKLKGRRSSWSSLCAADIYNSATGKSSKEQTLTELASAFYPLSHAAELPPHPRLAGRQSV
eukprot:7072344-Prymnesium_polylepis.1